MTKKYVSRAGEKLEGALKHFGVDPSGWVCMDVGAATGGFTDCLLQHDAKKVYAVETGKGVLDWKLRNNQQVVVLEKTNILYQVPIEEKVDLAVVDTSWTKLKLSVPATSRFAKTILALVKPHYEAEKGELRKGVVKSEQLMVIVSRTRLKLIELGFEVSEVYESPVTGESGNREYWVKLSPQV